MTESVVPTNDSPATSPLPDVRAMRLFVAIQMTAAVQRALADAQRLLRTRAALPVTWSSPDRAHLTLLFLGSVLTDHVPPLIAALNDVGPRHRGFVLSVGDLGAFPSVDAPRVLWLGVRGETDALASLQRDIVAAAALVEGIVPDHQAFRPHLTLGRATSGRCDQPGAAAIVAALARPIRSPVVVWPVPSFALIRSVLGAGGPRYTVLERFALHDEGQER